jgi:hypothetical protein
VCLLRFFGVCSGVGGKAIEPAELLNGSFSSSSFRVRFKARFVDRPGVFSGVINILMVDFRLGVDGMAVVGSGRLMTFDPDSKGFLSLFFLGVEGGAANGTSLISSDYTT